MAFFKRFSASSIFYNNLKKSVAFFIRHSLPPERWYSAALKITGLIAHTKKFLGVKHRDPFVINHAYMLNGVLSILTRFKIPFPIPVEARGLELFNKLRPNGVILCSVHIPLIKVSLRHLMEQGFMPTVAVAANPTVDGHIGVWGSTVRIPAILTGPFVLNKVRTVLKKGGTVVCLVDKVLGDDYSPNLFHLAQKVNADVIYFLAQLSRDGKVEVSFVESPNLAAPNETLVETRMRDLAEHVNRILQVSN